jgi:serine/threonine protein kinase
MPAPATVSEFLDLVRKSALADETKLTTCLDQLQESGSLPSAPEDLAGVLVRDGVLTYFQAEQILLGKWRRFTIGQYKVLERLGSGKRASVYLCAHSKLRRHVAVKVLPSSSAEDPARLERFFREAKALAALLHHNVVQLYEVAQDDKLYFLVMEHVDGGSLQHIVEKGGPLDPLRAALYIRQAALGLQHAHEKAGLVHREIEPSNVLVNRSGVVKIIDFGIARFVNPQDALNRDYNPIVLGEADYMAPEQCLDSHSVDIRADIYGLGGTFYYALTGRTPLGEGTEAEKLMWQLTRQPKLVRLLRHDVPEELQAVLYKMIAKDPADRYQTPIEVAEALSPFTQTPIPPPPESEMPQLCPAAMEP